MNYLKFLKYIPYILLAISIICNLFFFKSCEKSKDFQQSNSNQISKDSSTEVLYSVEEVQQFLADHDSAILAEIQPKYIDRLVVAKLSLKDSMRIANVIKARDSLSAEFESELKPEDDVRIINVEKDCYSVHITSYPDSSDVVSEFSSEITTIIYQRYKYKKFVKRLFNKWSIPFWDFSSVVDCESILGCNGDSLPIQNNIKVYRK